MINVCGCLTSPLSHWLLFKVPGLIEFSITIMKFLSSFPTAVINTHENSPKLPIHGDDDEITLGLNLPEGSNNLFKLNGKYLQLVHPLDRDKENLSHIQFSVSIKCTARDQTLMLCK